MIRTARRQQAQGAVAAAPRRLVVGLLAAALAASVLATLPAGATHQASAFCEPAGGDAGNDQNSATAITPPEACIGILGNADPADYYVMSSLAANRTIVASMRAAVAPTKVFRLGLLGPNGQIGECSQNDNGDVCRATNTAAGDWYLSVTRVNGGDGEYVLDVAVTEGVPDPLASCEVNGQNGDAGDQSSPADLPAVDAAEPLITAATCRGALGGALGAGTDTGDWYQFTSSSASVIQIAVAPAPDMDVQLTLMGPDPSPPVVVQTDNSTAEPEASLTVSLAASGTWKIGVELVTGPGAERDYTLAVTVTRP